MINRTEDATEEEEERRWRKTAALACY